MRDAKEKKEVLLSIRMTEEEKNILDYMCDYFGKSTTDVISRSYKFFLNTGGSSIREGTDDRKIRKNCQVHARISNTDRDRLAEYGKGSGETISQTIRKAIREFGESLQPHY